MVRELSDATIQELFGEVLSVLSVAKCYRLDKSLVSFIKIMTARVSAAKKKILS